MAGRLSPLENPVEIWHDGSALHAERGEPLACALIAENRLPIARSTKLHRARGPYCMRGACDGCLARVNGVPNVMTCQEPAFGGERIETQNVLGSRELDLLQASDFLFPGGIDHHRLLAGIRGVSGLLQAFARRVAGLGELPDAVQEPRQAVQRELDVLVVGGGRAGLVAARELGRRALLVDDQPELGGSLAALEPAQASALANAATQSGAELLPRTTAFALSREPDDGSGRVTAVLAGPTGLIHARCHSVLLATGCHDPVALFENNDLPGVISARAALRLWRRGIFIGKRLALLGTGRFAERFLELAGASLELVIHPAQAAVRATGRGHVSALVMREGDGQRRLRVDGVLVEGAGAPSFELSVQAGARTVFDAGRGYVPQSEEDGRVAPRVFCAGSCRSIGDSAADGERVARALSAR